MNAFQKRQRSAVIPIFMIYCILPLSITAGFSPHLLVSLFRPEEPVPLNVVAVVVHFKYTEPFHLSSVSLSLRVITGSKPVH